MRAHRLTLGLVAGLIVVLMIGIGGALAISRHQRNTATSARPSGTADSATNAAAGPVSGAASSAGGAASGSEQGATGLPSAARSGSASGDRSPGDLDPPVAAPGPSNNLTVQMFPAVRSHPRAAAAQRLLQAYFDAINQHDHAGWSSLVTAAMARSQSRAQWLRAYASTVDSSIWMQSMRDHPVEVTVRFTSEQDPDLAPPDLPVHCINWTLTYQLVDEAGALLVGSTVSGSVTKAECP